MLLLRDLQKRGPRHHARPLLFARIIAITGAILALRAAGVRRSALVLRGIGIFMALHIPPIGPVTLLFLSSAALLIERHRNSPRVRSCPMPAA